MAAPAIGFGADVATAEDFEIAWEFDKFLDDLEFIHAAKEAEIMDLFAEIVLAVILKIFFKFIALGILVVNSRAGNVAFVSGSFVADDNVL